MRVIRSVALGERVGSFDVTVEGERVSQISAAADAAPPLCLAMPSLGDAVASAKRERASASAEDIYARASRLFRRSIEHGVSSMRTHTDIDAITEMRAIDGVRAAATDSSSLDVEVVAFASAAANPASSEAQARFAEAVQRGASLIGAVPALCAPGPRTPWMRCWRRPSHWASPSTFTSTNISMRQAH
jgi:cytosine/adenosine deaminase-related metal-dependent hydrolase